MKHSVKACLLLIFILLDGCISSQEKALSEECRSAINLFNVYTTDKLIRDISKASSDNPEVKAQLKVLYPAARYKWNVALRNVKNNYNNNWEGLPRTFLKLSREELCELSVASLIEKNSNISTLTDDQKFFLLINLAVKGEYPCRTRDIIAAVAWVETASLNGRLASTTSYLNRCGREDTEKVKKLLMPKYLPQNFDEVIE